MLSAAALSFSPAGCATALCLVVLPWPTFTSRLLVAVSFALWISLFPASTLGSLPPLFSASSTPSAWLSAGCIGLLSGLLLGLPFSLLGGLPAPWRQIAIPCAWLLLLQRLPDGLPALLQAERGQALLSGGRLLLQALLLSSPCWLAAGLALTAQRLSERLSGVPSAPLPPLAHPLLELSLIALLSPLWLRLLRWSFAVILGLQ